MPKAQTITVIPPTRTKAKSRVCGSMNHQSGSMRHQWGWADVTRARVASSWKSAFSGMACSRLRLVTSRTPNSIV
jgi:hypothetical protein